MIEILLALGLSQNQHWSQPDAGFMIGKPLATEQISKPRNLVIAQASPVVSKNGFTFELLGCDVIAGASAPFQCDFLVSSTYSQTRTLGIYGRNTRRPSRVVDSMGNVIEASVIQLGSDTNDREAKTELTTEIPIRARISFEAIPEGSVRSIFLANYLYGRNGGGGGSFDVEYQFTD